MEDTAAARLPLDPETVFLLGNGLLRVQPSRGAPGPSWSQYMHRLWHLVHVRRHGDPGLLALGDFTQLSAPRQAEWFDREFPEGSRQDRATLRLHLLGQTLHQSPEFLTNPLLASLARLVLQRALDASQHSMIDVITTNVDCAIEQNLAATIDSWISGAEGPLEVQARRRLISAEIHVVVDFRVSARWVREPAAQQQDDQLPLIIRLWKLHGCLRDLKVRLSDEDARRGIVALAGPDATEFCGAVPTDTCLALHLGGRWQTAPRAREVIRRSFVGVFSQTEYFDNLVTLNELADARRRTGGAPASGLEPECIDLFGAFEDILVQRPLGLIGYSLLDEDVDIVFALQRFQPPPGMARRWRLGERREFSESRRERLRQMGIEWWTFEVPPIGFCREPGRLDRTARHEWRRDTSEWLGHLQRVVANAWLEPQLRSLEQLLLASRHPGASPRAARAVESESVTGGRLVVAGLGSIWHAFALRQSDDFPNPRRVSAQLSSVDAQVPGGSGLVPVMVAAAIAGPDAAGSLSFVSNVPRGWSGWPEIEEFCLSAGVDVRPWQPAHPRDETTAKAVGRTSHVIFFDPEGKDADTVLPRQRYILDVQSLADPEVARRFRPEAVPPARVPPGYQTDGGDDFLFSDKEVDGEVIRSWRGPTVYETGASGVELVTKLNEDDIRPTIWTGGVGSLVRTLVTLAGRMLPADDPPPTAGGILAYLDEHPQLCRLTACEVGLRRRYLAKLASFGKPGWSHDGVKGFSYESELAYGAWLRDHWFELGDTVRELMRPGGRDVLGPPDPRIGGGVLATIHEGGLMALWSWTDRPPESIVVRIDRSPGTIGHDSFRLDISCRVGRGTAGVDDGAARVVIDAGQLALEVGAFRHQFVDPSLPHRRNTLAAGDAVRGALAYGLWALAYRAPGILVPSTVARVMLARSTLATLKCYAGSFVDFLRLVEEVRGKPVWKALWGVKAA